MDAFDFNKNWYDLWMKQSKVFFEITEKKLNEVFQQNEFLHPAEHLQQVNQWLSFLKKQWDFQAHTEEEKTGQAYWNMVAKMCNDASELMMQEWTKRTKEQNPIKTIHDLYDIWLKSCHDVYQKSMQSKAYQDVCNEFMHTAFKFWQSAMMRG